MRRNSSAIRKSRTNFRPAARATKRTVSRQIAKTTQQIEEQQWPWHKYCSHQRNSCHKEKPMPVTIVTTLPAPTQAAATDSGSDAGAATGFADLLSDKLALSDAQKVSDDTALTTDLATDVDATTGESPQLTDLLATLGLVVQEDAASQEVTADAKPGKDKSDDALAADIAPEDAASVLAALGFATVPTTPAPATTQAANTSDALSAVSGSTGESAKAQVGTLALNTPTGLNKPALTDDQAAKFAATLTTAEEAVGTGSDSTDPAIDNTSSLISHVANHTSQPTVQHDASLSVNTPVRDQSWATDLGQKVVWLANADKQSAQLTLNPPEMGLIEVSVDVDNGNASVSFASANVEVRDAIETALPKLREMFANAGIELGQTNVGAQSFSQQQAGYGGQNQTTARIVSDDAILAAEATGTLQTGALTARQGKGMVDIFA
jgi:flagellar hook-length control protein FliK